MVNLSSNYHCILYISFLMRQPPFYYNCDNFLKSFKPYLLIQNFIAYYLNRIILDTVQNIKIECKFLCKKRTYILEFNSDSLHKYWKGDSNEKNRK